MSWVWPLYHCHGYYCIIKTCKIEQRAPRTEPVMIVMIMIITWLVWLLLHDQNLYERAQSSSDWTGSPRHQSRQAEGTWTKLRDERDDVGDGDVDISSDDGDHVNDGADNKQWWYEMIVMMLVMVMCKIMEMMMMLMTMVITLIMVLTTKSQRSNLTPPWEQQCLWSEPSEAQAITLEIFSKSQKNGPLEYSSKTIDNKYNLKQQLPGGIEADKLVFEPRGRDRLTLCTHL